MHKSKRTMKDLSKDNAAKTEQQSSRDELGREPVANLQEAAGTKPNGNIAANAGLPAKLKFCEPLLEEFATMGPIPRMTTLRRRPRSGPADFVAAVDRWLEFMGGRDPEGGYFSVLYYDKNGEPTHARGPVWSSKGGDDALREGEELAGALSPIRMKQAVRKEERLRYFREILFDALGPVNVFATNDLRLIFEEGLARLAGSADKSDPPQPRGPDPSGQPTRLAEAVAHPADSGPTTPKTDDNALGHGVGDEAVMDPGYPDERTAEEHPGHTTVEDAAGHEAERDRDGDDAEGVVTLATTATATALRRDEACQEEQSVPAASGEQLPLSMPSTPTKKLRRRSAA